MDLGWFGMISVFSFLQELPTNSRTAKGISRISPVNQPATERYRGPWKCLEMLDPRPQRQDLQNVFILPNHIESLTTKKKEALKTSENRIQWLASDTKANALSPSSKVPKVSVTNKSNALGSPVAALRFTWVDSSATTFTSESGKRWRFSSMVLFARSAKLGFLRYTKIKKNQSGCF